MTDLVIFLSGIGSEVEIQFARPIELSGRQHEIALKNISTRKLWYNIHNERYNDHRFRYYNGDDWKTITIPNGYYNLEDLSDIIHAEMENIGDVLPARGARKKQYDIRFRLNKATRKLTVEFEPKWQIDF